ncbi:nucleotidyltransferase domain-containing protein [Heliobacterium undosum]|uniref:Nucleotidyltransferase domain-containing protein n=1 Tax=Heliomicrobium undosum TaxID=121734 RepID=A0A845L199_9FIRM|nr:nucleotidyltransferase domain-containing protein [Heliomicrobium undosum]MZP28190.1 nucleotidyltransferase domain-containing protein [Heliomicrobium undosum]
MNVTAIPGVNRLIEELKKRPEVERIILFGSRARGDHEERSDIDLAIVAPDATQRQWFDILDAVEEADTLYSIDVLRWEEVSNALRDRIANEGKVLYERGAESCAEPAQSGQRPKAVEGGLART